MKIRGERECTECGTRWSYYETGSVGCPACGSLRSTGLDERREQTDLRPELDLTAVRNEVDEVSTIDLAEAARDACREYVQRRGFVRGGELVALDDTYLAAIELRYVAGVVAKSREVDDRTELYFLTLLRGADRGERPGADEVPRPLRAARGFAYATAVREYRRDVRQWAEDRTLEPDERAALERLGHHVKRIRMLDGDVPLETATTLVEAARDLGTALEHGDESAFEQCRGGLDRLDELE